MYILLTTITAVLGGYLFYKMKIPAGAMIGAIIFSAVFNLLTGIGEFPPEAKVVVQAIAGGFIGQRITRNELREMKNILGTSILMFVCMTLYTLLVGGIMTRVTQLDLATVLASTMPAGRIRYGTDLCRHGRRCPQGGSPPYGSLCGHAQCYALHHQAHHIAGRDGRAPTR